MSSDTFLALLAFVMVGGFTPGPNNMLLLASGVNFGFRRTLPHIAGIVIGISIMVTLVGLGLGRVFEAFPVAYTVLKVVGGAYLVFLAWKIASASRAEEGAVAGGAPMTFMQAALFQWVNVKGWVMVVTALAAYTVSDHYALSLAIVVAAFFVNSIASAATWAAFGTGLRHVLNDPRYYRYINLALALALILSIWPMVKH